LTAIQASTLKTWAAYTSKMTTSLPTFTQYKDQLVESVFSYLFLKRNTRICILCWDISVCILYMPYNMILNPFSGRDFSLCRHTSSAVHWTAHSVGTGRSFLKGKAAGAWN
jgi:hypothetical protein